MKYARLAILGVAVGAGLLAARIVSTSGPAPSPEPVAEAAAVIDKTDVLVASTDIALGSKLTEGDLTWASWPTDSLPQGVLTRDGDPDVMDRLQGQISRTPIFSGEPIREERLISTDKGFMAAILPKGMRAIAVSVESETTAGGFILPGDKVDVILTKSGSESNGAVSETILENVRVLAIDAVTAGEQDEKNVDPKRTATLELNLPQSEIIAQAQQVGTIALALRSAQDSADDAEKTVRRKRAVNYVKYGLPSQAASQ